MKNKIKREAFTLIELAIVLIVIGLLIGGITTAGYMVDRSKLAKAQTLTKNSIVNTTDGLALWLEATTDDSFGGEVYDGDTIATWYDINPQSETVYNITQSISSANEPTYTYKGINSLPALYFDGDNDNLINNDLAYITSSTHTIFLVINMSDNNEVHTPIAWNTSSGGNTQLFYAHTNGNLEIYTTIGMSAISEDLNNHDTIITTVVNDTNSTAYRNGVEKNTYNVFPATSGRFTMGGEYDGANLSNYFLGFIGELIIFDRALKDSERVAVEEYLSNKWGI